MNVQTIALPGVGAQALTTGGSGHQLNEATAAGAGRFVFRRTFGLRITTGGMADGIRFDVGAADLAATFAPLEIDMLDEPPTSVQQKDGQTLTVTLPVPMQLRRVTFSGSKKKAKKSKVPTGTVELYRLDGDALAKEFTTSAKDNSTIADEFIDGRFGIKLKGSAGYHDITPDVLHDVMAKGFPTSARLGLAELPASGQPLAPNFFAVIPGEVGRTPDVSGTAADAAAGLATALQQYFDGLTPPYPQTVDVLLVAESDAPCKLTTSTFAIPFGLVRTSFRAVLLRPADLADADSFAVRLSEASTPLTSYLRGLLTVETQQNLDRSSGGAVPPPVLAAIVQQLNSALQTEAFYTAPRFAGIDLKPETVAAAAAAPAGLARTRINRTLLEEAFASELVPLGKTGADEKEVLRATETNGAIDVSVDVPRTI
ncbi:MAG TPA: hypothetical protein VF021_00305, partial [Longimicrobiales bacterium]